MLTTRTARWSAVTGLVCVVVLVATWFVLVVPRRSEAADLGEQRVSVETSNVSLQATIAELERQYGDLPQRRAELKMIRQQLPPAADLAELVRAVSDFAEDAGVDITSVTPGDPTTVTPATGVAPAVVSLPVVIEVRGRYVEDALFVRYLQNEMKRVYLLTQLSVVRGEGEDDSTTSTPTATSTATPTATASAAPTSTALPDDFTLTITGEIFSLVDAPVASAPATPAPGGTLATTTN